MVLLYSWKFLPSSIHSHWYFEVTWQLTIKLFQAKISEWAALQNLWCQRVTVYCYPRKCWLMTTVAASLMNFQVQNFQLYNKSLKDWCPGKQLIFFPLNSMFPSASPRKHWDSWETKFAVSPWDQSLIVHCRLGCNLFMMLCYS